MSSPYAAAEAAIDAANAADPTLVPRPDGPPAPLALVHGQLAVRWVARLVPDADEALLLAARAHHLRRWENPRASYPEGRAGYLRWRRDQKTRHAHEVAVLLADAGYDEGTIARVQSLIKREGLARGDEGSQAIEDAASLVFVETQLADLAAQLTHEHLLDVLRKTAGKMSPAGIAALADVPLDDADRALLAEAFA